MQPALACRGVIYLDNNATTQIHPEVREAMEPFLFEAYGNPSAAYTFGKKARRAIDDAREQVAALIDAEPSEIVFTSCATESINTAFRSALRSYPDRKRIVTTTVEHSASLQVCQDLETQQIGVSQIPVNQSGIVDLDAFQSQLETGIALANVIWANNETGVISPVSAAAEAANEAGVLFHTDAVQATGKLSVSVKKTPVHLLSMSGHKFHAPKGIGALFISRHVRFHPLLFGGGQENERRSGTENVAGIVGLGKAAEIAANLDHVPQLQALRDSFEAKLREALPDIEINGSSDPELRLPNTSNVHFPNVDAEAMLILLDQFGVCASPGSACSSGSIHPSPVLTAMGFSKQRAKSSVRFSFSRFNAADEIESGIQAIIKAVERFRRL